MSAAFSESRHLSLLAVTSRTSSPPISRPWPTAERRDRPGKKKIELTGLIAESGRKRRELEAQEAENKPGAADPGKPGKLRTGLEEQKERAHQLQA